MAYSASFQPTKDYLLSHGNACRAVLISDDCAIDDALGVDRDIREPRGRLLFAALTNATDADIESLQRQRPFDRFPLPSESNFQAGVTEFRKIFMVDVRDVKDRQDRTASLGDQLAEDLAVRWTAFAARRGPLAAAKNAEKLAQLLAGSGNEPSQSQIDVAKLVAEVVARVWTFEGTDLDGVQSVLRSAADPGPFLKRLSESLEELSGAAHRAAAAMSSVSRK